MVLNSSFYKTKSQIFQIHCEIFLVFFFRKKLKKEKDKGNKQNGETSPTDNDESGFDGWSDDLPTASKTNDDDWSTDTSADAVAQRMSKLGVGVKGLTHNQDLEKSTDERFQIFFKFVKVITAFRGLC